MWGLNGVRSRTKRKREEGRKKRRNMGRRIKNKPGEQVVSLGVSRQPSSLSSRILEQDDRPLARNLGTAEQV